MTLRGLHLISRNLQDLFLPDLSIQCACECFRSGVVVIISYILPRVFAFICSITTILREGSHIRDFHREACQMDLEFRICRHRSSQRLRGQEIDDQGISAFASKYISPHGSGNPRSESEEVFRRILHPDALHGSRKS